MREKENKEEEFRDKENKDKELRKKRNKKDELREKNIQEKYIEEKINNDNKDNVFYGCANIVILSVRQREKPFFMRCFNNNTFGINQSIVFARILVMKWKIKRQIFDSGTMFFLLEED